MSMSKYFDKKKQLYVVRSYRKGVYTYVGQFETEEQADEAIALWIAQHKDSAVKDKFLHSPEWFEAESQRQLRDLPAKYPGFINGKPGKVPKLSNA